MEAVPGWAWDAREARWEEGFHHAREYVEKTGDVRIPSGFKTDSGFPLAGWMTIQRTAYRLGVTGLPDGHRATRIPVAAAPHNCP